MQIKFLKSLLILLVLGGGCKPKDDSLRSSTGSGTETTQNKPLDENSGSGDLPPVGYLTSNNIVMAPCTYVQESFGHYTVECQVGSETTNGNIDHSSVPLDQSELVWTAREKASLPMVDMIRKK